MSTQEVDIIVIGRNEERFLPRCLDSAHIAADRLMVQSGVSCHITYVDSHSTDQSVSIAKQAGVSVRFTPPAFRTPANGRMAGLLQTDGEYIMFLDGDMELKPDFLIEALKFMREHPKAAVRGIWDDLRFQGEDATLIPNIDKIGSEPTHIKAYFGGAVFARREAIEDVGGYEVCLLIQEEMTLYCKLKNAGWETYHLPVPMITHCDAKLASVKEAIFHILIGPKPMMTGVLLRHAVLKTPWWPILLRYQSPQLIHGAMLALFGGLIWWFFRLDSGRLFCGAGILALSVLYALSLVREKHSLSRGLAAVILRTIYFVNLCVSFFFYYPKTAFGFQNSEEYGQMVVAANKESAREGKTL